MTDVDVPAVGKVSPKALMLAGGAVAVIVSVAYMRKRGAAAGAAGPIVADPATGTNTADPNYANPNPTYTSDPDRSKLPPATDQEWTARVMDAMGSWLEPSYLSTVLGKYLGRQPLSLDEAATIRAAWAIAGKPPSGTPLTLTASGSTPGSTTVTPAPATPAPAAPAAAGARYVTVVAWNKTNPPWNSTLSGIAKHEGTTVAKLQALNPSITNPNLIHPGQKIRVA